MKHFILILAIMVANMCFAQKSFNGIVHYEIKRQTHNLSNNKEMVLPPELLKQIEEQLKKMATYQCKLTFDTQQSSYSKVIEEQTLSPSPVGETISLRSSFNGESLLYKNIQAKTFMEEVDMFGKAFVVSDSLPIYTWELTTETKQIGDYTCSKAIGKRVLTSAEKETLNTKQNENSKNLSITNNNSDEVTVWYCLDIPVSHGPEKFFGLPGLILEVNAKSFNILCSKIVLNSKEFKEVKQPKKGDKVTQKEFDALFNSKREQMKSQIKGQEGKNMLIMGQ
jgi:GLPGLI family protein